MAESAIGRYVCVRGRFHRSVHLGRDWNDRTSLRAYLATPTVQKLTLRIVESVADPLGSRAWSLTGPFGSGKSAFAVFLTDALARQRPIHPEARVVRRAAKLRRAQFLPVIAVGRRSRLTPALVLALAEAFRPHHPDYADRVLMNKATDAEGVWQLFREATDIAEESGFSGLLVIVDEFGKFLEHAVLHPRDDDLFVLQHLAEGAARSPGRMLLLTIQHTAFADYVQGASRAQAAEWIKIQGRFTDEAFYLPPEQMLGLLGASLQTRWPVELAQAYEYQVASTLRVDALEEARQRIPLDTLLPACVPFDPIAALLLWPLFRSKMAQNERSLFAFLTSHEPHGFQEFLETGTWSSGSPPLFRVDRFYDYVTEAIGSAALLGDRARHWAEIRHALDRLPVDAPPEATAVIKVIALLGLYGPPVGLKASRSMVQLATGDAERANRALDYLQARSFVIHRRYQDDFALWEGSDIDLDACFQQAVERVGAGTLAERIQRVAPPRPWVARRHYIENGTLRYFDVQVVDGSPADLARVLAQRSQERRGDGIAIFVLAKPTADREALIAIAQEFSQRAQEQQRLCLVGFPTPSAGVEEATLELEAWRWVNDHEPALAHDPVARQEVRARMAAARDRLGDLAGRVLGMPGHPFAPEASVWVYAGARQPLRSARPFSRWLSELCDEAFAQSPTLRNELLNRSQLSSAAAKARRNLLEAMIVHEREWRLGLEGSPPEATMYDAVLHASKLHRQREGTWGFGTPRDDWLPVWQAIQDFLATTTLAPQPVTALKSLLQAPPFGLRSGPVPIVLLAVLLAQRDEIALYEGGVYVPQLRIEHIERLLHRPEDFCIRLFKSTEEMRQLLRAVARIVADDGDSSGQLIGVVKPLVVFSAQLPPFSRQTRRFDEPKIVAVRQALLRATDPYELMFRDLPRALGVDISTASAIATFTDQLQDAIKVLQGAYSRLLLDIETAVREFFALMDHGDEGIAQLRARATNLLDYAADRRLTTFIREVVRETADWREGIGRVVADGVPPSHWKDTDIVAFHSRLQLLASDFVRLEELAFEHRRNGGEATIVRVDILNGRHEGARTLLTVSSETEPFVAALTERVRQVLDEAPAGSEQQRVRLAALARTLVREIGPRGDGDRT